MVTSLSLTASLPATVTVPIVVSAGGGGGGGSGAGVRCCELEAYSKMESVEPTGYLLVAITYYSKVVNVSSAYSPVPLLLIAATLYVYSVSAVKPLSEKVVSGP